MEELYGLARLLEGKAVTLVGGQALNLWAEFFFDHAPEVLTAYAPFTSKDIDYLGLENAARALAEAAGGKVITPNDDDLGPNVAIVWLPLNGRWIRIDFLTSLAGVSQKRLTAQNAVVELTVPADDAESDDIVLNVLHPVPVLMSRAGNIAVLCRDDEQAMRQMRAAVIVVREYAWMCLRNGDLREAARVVREVARWGQRDLSAREVYARGICDPFDAVAPLVSSQKWDIRFRERSLRPEIERARKVRDRGLAEARRKSAHAPS